MNIKNQLTIAILFASISAIYRVVDAQLGLFHLTPILSLALFAGFKLKNNAVAIATPLIGMFLADSFFELFTNTPGFYGMSQVLNYASIAAVVLLGKTINSNNGLKLLGFSVSGALLFWVLSNFGVWAGGPSHGYATNLNGLKECFIAALPFYKSSFATKSFVNSIFGTVIFTYVFVYGYNYIAKTYLKSSIA